MKIGDLVKTTGHRNARAYPKGVGFVTSDMGNLTCGPNDIVYVMWPDTGMECPVRIMFLEVLSEKR